MIIRSIQVVSRKAAVPTAVPAIIASTPYGSPISFQYMPVALPRMMDTNPECFEAFSQVIPKTKAAKGPAARSINEKIFRVMMLILNSAMHMAVSPMITLLILVIVVMCRSSTSGLKYF